MFSRKSFPDQYPALARVDVEFDAGGAKTIEFLAVENGQRDGGIAAIVELQRGERLLALDICFLGLALHSPASAAVTLARRSSSSPLPHSTKVPLEPSPSVVSTGIKYLPDPDLPEPK